MQVITSKCGIITSKEVKIIPRLFVHTHSKGKADWVNEYYEFSRVPIEGEVFATSTESPWYQVELIVHTPFEEDTAAEVYASEVDPREIKDSKLKLKTGKNFEF